MSGRDQLPGPAEWRQFGLLFGALFALFGGLLIPWLWSLGWPLWPWAVGAAFALTGLAAPVALRPLYTGWMRLGHALGWLNSRIILTLLFVAVVTPTGLLLKLFGKDPMRRRPDPGRASYREQSHAADRESLRRPF